MTTNVHGDAIPPPVAIGGVGGSGTRLVAELVRALGVHIGDDLNHACDTLLFTLLFKRIEILRCTDTEFDLLTRALVSGLQGTYQDRRLRSVVMDCADHDRPLHPAAWLKVRADSMLDVASHPPHPGRWGWKEPNTHIVIERLWLRLPTLRYVHVVRHGLDMAHSPNQGQLRLWGPHVLGEDGPVTPARSLAYWCRVHHRMQQLLADNPQRMYWLDYDAVCRDPEPELDGLCRFLGYEPEQCRPLYPTVHQRPFRHVGQPIDAMAPEDIAYVRSLGYQIQAAA